MSQALYRKWRPQNWSDLIGQEHIVKTLKNAIQSNRLVHAYLFAGPRGTGKTSTARLVAKTVNCLYEDISERPCNKCEICTAINQGRFLDLIEIDAASNTSVDDVRDLRDKINYSPSQGQYKVYIIDEVHMLSTAAFNALLKTLEEPPPHAIFVLATTEIHKIPATVLSRCQRHEFRRISNNDIVHLLEEIVREEKLSADPAALALIARQSTGALRDAISLLDQLSSTGGEITLDYANDVLGTATNQSVINVIEAILQKQRSEGLTNIHNALNNGTDPRQYARQIVEYLRNILLVKMGNPSSFEVTDEVRAQIERHATQFNERQLIHCLQRFNSTASDTRSNWQPNLPLELSFADCMDYQNVEPLNVTQPSVEQDFSSFQPTHLETNTKTHENKQASKKISVKTQQVQTSEPQPEAYQKRSPLPTIEHEQENLEKTSPDTAATKLSLKIVRDHWDEIRAQVRSERPQTEGLLNSCKSITIKNGGLVIGFASEVVKSKMDTNENLALVANIISKIIGIEVTVFCSVVNKNMTGSTTDSTLEGDGMVNAAMGLGGQIVQHD